MKIKSAKLFKNYLIPIYFILIITKFNAQTSSEFNTINNRIETTYMQDASNKGWVITDFQAGGTFQGIDYSNFNKEAYGDHLQRTFYLAQNYKLNPEDSIRDKYFDAMVFFLHNLSNIEDEIGDNTDWYLIIGFPRLVAYCHFLMRDFTFSHNNPLFRDLDDYIIEAYDKRTLRYGHASDVVQIIEPLFSFYSIKKDSSKVNILMTDLSKQLQFAKHWETFYNTNDRNSGIETDYSFTAHNGEGIPNGNGRQIYNANYGKVYIENVSKLFHFSDNTSIELDTYYDIFSDFLVEGNQWTHYKNTYDNGVSGRSNGNHLSKENFKKELSNSLGKYLTVKPPRSIEINKILDRIQLGITETNFLKGNKYFWRSDMMIHRNRNYHFSVRMSSDRTVAPETDDTAKNFYAGAGVSYLMKNGDEYRNDYYNNFNHRQFPGITAEQDSRNLNIDPYNWGKDGKNENDFAGGVTNGEIGACGMIWKKRDSKAHKSWFMFENEIVALGAGINQSNGDSPVVTTINQSKRDTPIKYKILTTEADLQGTQPVISSSFKWLFHNSVGYYNLIENQQFEFSQSSNSGYDLFNIGINHGINPTNEKYAYIIKPDINISQVNNNPSQYIQILKNTDRIQSVYHVSDDIFQAVFFKAGQVTIPNWDNTIIRVNEPSLIIIKRNLNSVSDTYDDTFTFVVSNAKGENSTTRYKEISFTKPYTRLRLLEADNQNDTSIVSIDQHENILSFDAWDSRWGGQSSRIKEFGRECSVVSATSNDGNPPYNTRDNSLFSRWSSNGLGEYIQYKVCHGLQDINYVDIAFYRGNLRHANFKISVKYENAQQYEDVTFNSSTIIQSSGNSNEKQRFYFDSEKQDVVYIRYTGYGNDEPLREGWNSITEFDWGKDVSSKQQLKQKISIESSFSIFPNPTETRVNILSDEYLSKITLYSIDGKSIRTYNNINSKKIELDLSKYETGIYLLKVLYKNGEYKLKKLIKE
jgi:chondroitin AC lyase